MLVPFHEPLLGAYKKDWEYDEEETEGRSGCYCRKVGLFSPKEQEALCHWGKGRKTHCHKKQANCSQQKRKEKRILSGVGQETRLSPDH